MRLKRYSKHMLYLLICKSEVPLLKDKFYKIKRGEEVCIEVDGSIEKNKPVSQLQILSITDRSKIIYNRHNNTLKLFINTQEYMNRKHMLELGKNEDLKWLFEDEGSLFPFEALEVDSEYSINWFSVVDVYEE